MGGVRNPYLELTDWDWPIDPVGLRYTLNRCTTGIEFP